MIKKLSLVSVLALSLVMIAGHQVDANYGNMGTNGANTNNQGTYNTNYQGTDNQGTYNTNSRTYNNGYGARTTATDNGTNWGWLGLLGLAGLTGLMGRNRNPEPDRR